MCSAILVSPVSLLSDLYTPTFQWFFGPNSNDSLPSGVTPMVTNSCTINSTRIIYTSTLHFSRMDQHLHTWNYTCRIGAGMLFNKTTVTVNGMKSYYS